MFKESIAVPCENRIEHKLRGPNAEHLNVKAVTIML
jgi:hypothetical protein